METPIEQEAIPTTTQASTSTEPVVIIDGPYGCGIEEVATQLAERLHLPIIDPMHIREKAIADEKNDEAWQQTAKGLLATIESWIAHLHLRPGMDRSERRMHMEHAFQDEAQHGGVIFGLYPHIQWDNHPLFRLRMNASVEYCVRHIARSRMLPMEEAMQLFQRMEADRHQLLHEMIEENYTDLQDFDLTVTADALPPEEISQRTLSAMTEKGVPVPAC